MKKYKKVLAAGLALTMGLGLAACGSAGKDSHHDLPDVTESWSEKELLPYREAFRRGWPGMVLVAHIHHGGMDAVLPSSLSPAVIEGLLRRELGWNGVVISDDLQMGAVYKGRSLEERVRLALLAGNDILLFGNYDNPVIDGRKRRFLSTGSKTQGKDKIYRVIIAWWKKN